MSLFYAMLCLCRYFRIDLLCRRDYFLMLYLHDIRQRVLASRR